MDPEKIEVRRVAIRALPVVNAVLGRLRFEEGRSCTAPTAARVIKLLESLSTTSVLYNVELLAVSPPEPDALQRQILSLLKVALRAYGIEKRSPRHSR